jgi:hypothetical protein
MQASSFERNCRDYFAQDKILSERRLPIEQTAIGLFVILVLLIDD